MKKREENNELIAAFMGFPIKTKVTVYNYGYDFRDSYDTEIIYSNIKPILVEHEDKFVNQVISTYTDYFDKEKQKENFEYTQYLNYDSNWDSLMKVAAKINQMYPSGHRRVPFTGSMYLYIDNIDKLYQDCIDFIKDINMNRK